MTFRNCDAPAKDTREKIRRVLRRAKGIYPGEFSAACLERLLSSNLGCRICSPHIRVETSFILRFVFVLQTPRWYRWRWMSALKSSTLPMKQGDLTTALPAWLTHFIILQAPKGVG